MASEAEIREATEQLRKIYDGVADAFIALGAAVVRTDNAITQFRLSLERLEKQKNAAQ